MKSVFNKLELADIYTRQFIPRENSVEAAKKRARVFCWGGQQEQQIVRQMRNPITAK